MSAATLNTEATTQDQGKFDNQTHSVLGGRNLPADRSLFVAHAQDVGGDQNTAQGQIDTDARVALALGGHNFPDGHTSGDAHTALAVGGNLPAGVATAGSVSNDGARLLLDSLLTLASITLDDLEKLRIAQENRYRSLTQLGTSENGLEYGFGLDDRDPNVAAAGALVDSIKQMEHQANLQLQKLMRKHPLGPWVKAQKGVGDKQAARLLGVTGDPYWHAAEDRPRTVSELWAYCGLRPGQRRRKGEKANWSTESKTRAYLIAEATMKQLDKQCKTDTGIAEHVEGCGCSVYRRVYDARRAHTAERTHEAECVRCGPSGKPAQPGSPWSKAHQMADALRVVSKEILKDLWRESRRLHHAAQ